MPKQKPLLAYIVLWIEAYQGSDTYGASGEDDDPIPTFTSRADADAYCDRKRIPQRNREIIAIDLMSDTERKI